MLFDIFYLQASNCGCKQCFYDKFHILLDYYFFSLSCAFAQFVSQIEEGTGHFLNVSNSNNDPPYQTDTKVV